MLGALRPGIGGAPNGRGGAGAPGCEGVSLDSLCGLLKGICGANVGGAALEGPARCFNLGIPPANMSPNWGPAGAGGTDGTPGLCVGTCGAPMAGAPVDAPRPATCGAERSLVSTCFSGLPLRMSPNRASRPTPAGAAAGAAAGPAGAGGPPIGGGGGGGGAGIADLL